MEKEGQVVFTGTGKMMTRNGYNGGIKVHAPSLREELLSNVTPERIHSSVSKSLLCLA